MSTAFNMADHLSILLILSCNSFFTWFRGSGEQEPAHISLWELNVCQQPVQQHHMASWNGPWKLENNANQCIYFSSIYLFTHLWIIRHLSIHLPTFSLGIPLEHRSLCFSSPSLAAQCPELALLRNAELRSAPGHSPQALSPPSTRSLGDLPWSHVFKHHPHTDDFQMDYLQSEFLPWLQTHTSHCWLYTCGQIFAVSI